MTCHYRMSPNTIVNAVPGAAPRCEGCSETENLHMIGGAWLCDRHVDLPFCRDVNPGERLPDPDGIDES